MADLLGKLPGIQVEATGGEVQNVTRVRGIPTDDGYALFQQDGLPLMTEINGYFFRGDSMNRYDLMTKTIEVVRGGPAPIYASQAAAIVNSTTVTGTSKTRGKAQVSVGTTGLKRLDAYQAGQIDDRTFYAIGGFIREDDGHRDNGFARARSIDWKRYKYTAIIIPGVGPENPAIAMSARGKLHLKLAASRFADGTAAFIFVSGAAVHPKESRFVEAVEMRKVLIERYNVPADRIIIEPYARHTTTNLRNVTRGLVAMGAPIEQPTLIVANISQSRYIESPEFAARNPAELGYQPGAVGPRLSPYELEFRPSLRSLRVDPWDPLDP